MGIVHGSGTAGASRAGDGAGLIPARCLRLPLGGYLGPVGVVNPDFPRQPVAVHLFLIDAFFLYGVQDLLFFGVQDNPLPGFLQLRRKSNPLGFQDGVPLRSGRRRTGDFRRRFLNLAAGKEQEKDQ